MNSGKGPAILALLGIAVAAALFFVLRGDDEESTVSVPSATEQTPGITKIVVRDGEPVGGIAEIEVEKGDTIAFEVESDIDEEVHLHGYDVSKEVTAGGSVSFDVPATIEGVFEAELEGAATQIAEVSVVP